MFRVYVIAHKETFESWKKIPFHISTPTLKLFVICFICIMSTCWHACWLPGRTTQDHAHKRGGRILSSPEITGSLGTSVPSVVVEEVKLDPTRRRCVETVCKKGKKRKKFSVIDIHINNEMFHHFYFCFVPYKRYKFYITCHIYRYNRWIT